MKPVIVSIAARRELREAQDWYREKGEELAERFEEDFANSAKLVQRNPSLYPVFYNRIGASCSKIFRICLYTARKDRQFASFLFFTASAIHDGGAPAYKLTQCNP